MRKCTRGEANVRRSTTFVVRSNAELTLSVASQYFTENSVRTRSDEDVIFFASSVAHIVKFNCNMHDCFVLQLVCTIFDCVHYESVGK